MFMRKKFNLFDENAGEEYFNHEDIPLHRFKNASSMAPSVDELYNLVDEDRPVVLCLDTDEMVEGIAYTAAGRFQSASAVIAQVNIDPKDIEKERFGWRYPSLYEAKGTTEDMTMAAARLIESSHFEEGGDAAQKADPVALLEAKLFIENEVPLFSCTISEA